MKPPPIRESESHIEIDATKGAWPFMRAQVVRRESDGKRRLLFYIDCNEAGQVIGEGQGLAGIVFSPKKARALRDFLDRVLDDE